MVAHGIKHFCLRSRYFPERGRGAAQPPHL